MKLLTKIYTILSLTALSLTMTGCSEDLYSTVYSKEWEPALEPHYLGVKPRDFEFKSEGDTKSGTVSSGTVWKFTDVPSWLSVNPASGNSDANFNLTAGANNTVTSRTSVFYLTSSANDWNVRRAITATQTAGSPYLKFVGLEGTTVYKSAATQSFTVEVDTNIDDLVPSVDYADWLSVSYNKATKLLKITLEENKTSSYRSSYVYLNSSKYSKSINLRVYQYAPSLTIDDITSMSFDADGGSRQVKIKSDVAWTASADKSWIEVSPASGKAGEQSVTVTVLPSYQTGNRNGEVLFKFSNGSSAGRVSVVQSGRYITATPTSITINSDGVAQNELTIESNIGWEIVGRPEWLSFNRATGDAGTSSITLSATKNNSLNSRSGYLTIWDINTGSIETRVSVTQNGLEFGDNTTLEFGWQASSMPLEIPIPNSWSAAVSDGWISLSKYQGSGNTTINVSVEKSTLETPRVGIINFSSEGKIISVKVVQQGQYISINATSGEISANGGEMELYFDASLTTDYTVEYSSEDEDWVSVESFDGKYTLSVDFNNSIAERSANFVIQAVDDDANENYKQGVKFQIIQKGRKLSCSVQKIIMGSPAANSEVYSINSEGAYEIVKDDADFWYTLVNDTNKNSFYIITTTNTSGATREGTLTLRMKNLPTSETSPEIIIPVTQKYQGANIGIDDFGEDENWN